MGEFKQIQEILSKIGTEIFKIDEEMTEKNETEDGNSISLKSPWHMKWDRQQFLQQPQVEGSYKLSMIIRL